MCDCLVLCYYIRSYVDFDGQCVVARKENILLCRHSNAHRTYYCNPSKAQQNKAKQEENVQCVQSVAVPLALLCMHRGTQMPLNLTK